MPMKKTLLTLAGASLLVFTFVSLTPDQTSTDIIMMRSMQSHSMENRAKILVIVKADGSSEHMEMLNIDKKPDNVVANLKTESDKVKEILSQGYYLEHFSCGGDAGINCTYIFKKK
jgi:hypothetical protein